MEPAFAIEHSVSEEQPSGTAEFGVVEGAPSQSLVVLEPGKKLTIKELYDVAVLGRHAELSKVAFERMAHSNRLLNEKIARGETIYGVNTGFGGNCHYLIPGDNASRLQNNLLLFLTAGTGENLPVWVVRAAMLLRANALAQGWSAARPEVVVQILNLLNAGMTPMVPAYGSVGASGDLIPSAYIARALLGEGEVLYRGKIMPAAKALDLAGIKPITLKAKEGLALVNGTTLMTAYAALAVYDFEFTFRVGLAAIALAVEALRSSSDYFDARLQHVKGHPGQIAVASFLRKVLAGSQLCVGHHSIREEVAETGRLATETHAVTRAKTAVQAPYSLRCVSQGLGPIFESLRDAEIVVEREMNSVNDNPLLDPDTGDVLHGGNFFGAHVAREMDALKLDICYLANWTHSILGVLMDERFSQGLPNSLSPKLGIFQGLKGLQLSQTALVVQLRRDSAPSSIHTLPTEQFNQDVVSLGTHAASTTYGMTRMLRDAVAMTLLAVAQAIDIRSHARGLAVGTSTVFSAIRGVSPFVEEDRALHADIAAVSDLIADRRIPVLDFD